MGCSTPVPTTAELPATGPIVTDEAPPPRQPLPAPRWQEAAPRLTAALTQRGYTVQAGEVRFFQIEDCLQMSNCAGNNPTSPYGMYCLPPAPGDTPARDPEPPCPLEGDLRWVWRLRPDEAIVFLGQTPPRSRYFSFHTYVFSRQGWFRHRELFASLGDALNFKRLATTSTPDGSRGNPFARETVVITTADRNIDSLLRQTLSSVGVPEAIVNTESLPFALLKMGLEGKNDIFTMLFRVALFADREAGERYVETPPATVLRITPPAPVAVEPFPVQPLRPRGTHTSEAWLQPALDELTATVEAHYRPLDMKRRRTLTLNLIGRNCLERGTLCLGDVSDTAYSTSIPARLSDHPKDFFVVVGVHHEATGKASYINLGVYHTRRLMGIGAVTGDELAGSAERYLPNHPASKYLYAYKFARDCRGEPFCFDVPTGERGVPLAMALNFIERPYLEPGTEIGPLTSQLLEPRALHFCPSFTLFGRCDP
jgi:hypothetical protein